MGARWGQKQPQGLKHEWFSSGAVRFPDKGHWGGTAEHFIRAVSTHVCSNKLTFASQLTASGRSNKFIWQLKQQTRRVQEGMGWEEGWESFTMYQIAFIPSLICHNLCDQFHLHFNLLDLDITLCFSEPFLRDCSSRSAVSSCTTDTSACVQQIRKTWVRAPYFLPTQPPPLTSV